MKKVFLLLVFLVNLSNYATAQCNSIEVSDLKIIQDCTPPPDAPLCYQDLCLKARRWSLTVKICSSEPLNSKIISLHDTNNNLLPLGFTSEGYCETCINSPNTFICAYSSISLGNVTKNANGCYCTSVKFIGCINSDNLGNILLNKKFIVKMNGNPLRTVGITMGQEPYDDLFDYSINNKKFKGAGTKRLTIGATQAAQIVMADEIRPFMYEIEEIDKCKDVVIAGGYTNKKNCWRQNNSIDNLEIPYNTGCRRFRVKLKLMDCDGQITNRTIILILTLLNSELLVQNTV